MRIPTATYRLQFHKDFGFAAARELIGYLRELGISDVYASPIFKARAGSLHGYDVVDHRQIDPVLGGAEEFDRFAAALQEHGMGLILDIVPNHMGIGEPSNVWWMDVLENGPSSSYAAYFDIDWQPVNPHLENKVLLPILGDQYGVVLEDGKLRLAHEDGAFFIHYETFKLPVTPRTYSSILSHTLDSLNEALEKDDEHLLELQSILTAISHLPLGTEADQEDVQRALRDCIALGHEITSIEELVGISRSVTTPAAYTISAVRNRWEGERRDRAVHLERLGSQQIFALVQSGRGAPHRRSTSKRRRSKYFGISATGAPLRSARSPKRA